MGGDLGTQVNVHVETGSDNWAPETLVASNRMERQKHDFNHLSVALCSCKETQRLWKTSEPDVDLGCYHHEFSKLFRIGETQRQAVRNYLITHCVKLSDKLTKIIPKSISKALFAKRNP